MASEGTSKNKENFVIRHATSLDDLQWVMRMAAEEGFTPREKEAECYFTAGLTPYFYIGELNGEKIGCISHVRHGESVVVGSYYIIATPYRGTGFGREILDYSWADCDKCNIQTFSLMYLKDHHQKRGLQPGWMVKVYKITASCAVQDLASCRLPPSVEILPANQADFEKLFAYSANMLGTSQTCKSLLAAWLCHLQESSWVAIDNKGEVVGYLMMSKTINCFPEDGSIIAPFYADSAPIARSLLKVAVEFASASNPRHIIAMETPVDYNPEFVSILEKEIGARCTCDVIHMAKEVIPSTCLSKVFSIASCHVLSVV